MRARDNPFRSECVERLAYRAPGFDWRAIRSRLASHAGRVAIRGPEGSGKTTLLHELGDRLAAEGSTVRRLRPDPDDRKHAARQVRRFAAGSDARTVLLLDGADRLGWLEWRSLARASRAAGGLVVTTHREGRLPTLHRCATSPALLARLVLELEAGILRADPGELFRRHGGNLRLALRELYDLAADFPSVQPHSRQACLDSIAASG